MQGHSAAVCSPHTLKLYFVYFTQADIKQRQIRILLENLLDLQVVAFMVNLMAMELSSSYFSVLAIAATSSLMLKGLLMQNTPQLAILLFAELLKILPVINMNFGLVFIFCTRSYMS